MISQEQVRIVRQALLLREKNQYTQTPLRLLAVSYTHLTLPTNLRV